MAASIYATPPPDLSSEDTALSDLSNTSTTTTKTTVVETPATSTTQSTTSIKTKFLNQNYYLNTTEAISATSATSDTTTTTTTTAAAIATSASSLKNQQHIRTVADVANDNNSPPSQCSSIPPPIMGSSRNVNDDPEATTTPQNNTNANTTTAMAAVAAAANAAMQLQFIEAINDAAKKRRKQTQPNRMEGKAEANNHIGNSEQLNRAQDSEQFPLQRISASDNSTTVDYEDKLSKMLLPKSMEKLKETFELFQQQQQQKQQTDDISTDMSHKKTESYQPEEKENSTQEELQAPLTCDRNEPNTNPYQTFCRQCGENFENEFKLSLHMLQEHNPSSEMGNQQHLSPLDILQSVRVKMERPDCDSPSSNHNSDSGNEHNAINAGQQHILPNGKHQMAASWMANAGNMPPMGFPFPPEAAAAAALQAGGYLPLLGMTGFPGVDGLNRPPLRIFNPEAFCELCNKEFCNKYFLKTHKANKHGIYDPFTDNAGSTAAVNGSQQSQQSQSQNLNAMNQMFQLQMQQQQQHLQQQQQIQMELQQQNHKDNLKKELEAATNAAQSQQLTAANAQTVYCDICSKRFTNAFALRRHKSKVHEQNSSAQRQSPPTDSSAESNKTDAQKTTNGSENIKQFQMPDGFRQDFALEQEDVSFTPQPRKLSPQFQQQAREANFAHDKLKQMGVLNPDAFCELCCKEYCNKYFLRTHKWKRHGIFLPADDNPDSSQKFPPSWPFMNMPGMAPMNLMMAQRMMGISSEQQFEDTLLQQSQQPMSKRIKLEVLEKEEELKELNSQENQENRGDNNLAHSIPSTPEPAQKILTDSQHMNSNSAEATMGLQNLQKLQSMIQQLNDLNGKRPVACHLCGREMENHYALQAHIISEHGNNMDPATMAAMNFPPSSAATQIMLQQQALLKQSPNGSPGTLLPPLMAGGMPGEMRCTPCDRDFTSLSEFQKHIAEVHLLASTESPLREGFATPERPINSNMAQGGTRPPYTITPTSSYCEICNKELCNKYFMKTHMQRMHGIEIENGSQIGGVVCNICNKELCSKYFLRVHKHNTHGIIEDGSPLPQPRQNGLKLELALQQQMLEGEAISHNLSSSPFGSGGSEGKNDSSSYQEICTLCSRQFRNIKWLKSHLLSDHGAAGSEKVRELELQYGSLSKPSSPTLKIPNGSTSSVGCVSAPLDAAAMSANVPSPAQLAQALQNLNAQHLLQQSEQTSPRLKEYQCSMCPFTTPYYAFLFIHERTHSIINNNKETAAEVVKNLHEEAVPQRKRRSEKPKSQDDPQLMETDEAAKFKNAAQNSAEVITLDLEDDIDMKPVISINEFKSSMVENPFAHKKTKVASPSPPILAAEIAQDLQSRSTPTELKSPTTNEEPQADTSTGQRTIACSPAFSFHQQLLQEVANQTAKIASFAVPTTKEFSNSAPQMQAFVLEAATNEGKHASEDAASTAAANRFVPAIIYLPVTERLTGSLKLSFNLTPV